MAAAIISGTKRKISKFLGIGKADPENSGSSSKKRKLQVDDAATIKAKNAQSQSAAAREQAEREAGEHSRQIASRENRAMKRSISELASKRARAAKLRGTKASTVTVTRHTKVSFPHRITKAGALKSVKKPISAALRRKAAALKPQKGLRGANRPSTPVQDSSDVPDSEDDASPNITPASLRSASRNAHHFSPNNRGSRGSDLGRTFAARTKVGKVSQARQRATSSAMKGNAKVKAMLDAAPARARSLRGQ